MKKVLILLSVLHQPFVQHCAAEEPIVKEMTRCDNFSEQLIVQLNDMSILDAQRTLSHADYSLKELEEGFKKAHELGKPMALINIAHELSLRYLGTDKLSKLLSTSQGISLPALLINRTNQNLEKNLGRIKKNLVKSYKINLPNNTKSGLPKAMAHEIVSYIQQILQVNSQYDVQVNIKFTPKKAASYGLKQIKDHTEVRRLADILNRWKID